MYTTSGVDSEGLHKLLLLLPDGFGLAPHNVILADNFAKQGWEVIAPDYFEGEHPLSPAQHGAKGGTRERKVETGL